MRVVVAGAAGVVGSAVCRGLAGSHDVIALDRLAPADESDDLQADLRDVEAIRDALSTSGPVDAVVQTAMAPSAAGASTDLRSRWEFEVSVLGTWNLLQETHRLGARRVVFMSSLNVYGDLDGDRLEESLDLISRGSADVTEPYGLAKHLGEKIVEYWCTAHGMTGIAMRLDSVHSPGVMERRGIHVDDIGDAVRHALHVDLTGFAVVNLTADPARFNAPNDRARRLLGWAPMNVFDRDPQREDWPRPAQPPL